MGNPLDNYREHLIKADQKSQEDFDKTLVTVATSSLGVSLVFIREFVGDGPIASPYIILIGWLLLASSVGSVLLGFYLSRYALRKAIKQIDEDKIYSERPGGNTALVVEILNGLSGAFLLLGVSAVIIFAYSNLLLSSKMENTQMANNNSSQDGQKRGQVPPPPPPKPIGTGDSGHQSGYIPPPPPAQNPPPSEK